MLFRIGQHAVQRAGDDGLVAHETAFDCSLVKRVPLTRSLRQNTATGSDVTDANPHDLPQAPSRPPRHLLLLAREIFGRDRALESVARLQALPVGGDVGSEIPASPMFSASRSA